MAEMRAKQDIGGLRPSPTDAASSRPSASHLLLAVHGLVLLQRSILPLRVAPQLDDLTLTRQAPLPGRVAATKESTSRQERCAGVRTHRACSSPQRSCRQRHMSTLSRALSCLSGQCSKHCPQGVCAFWAGSPELLFLRLHAALHRRPLRLHARNVGLQLLADRLHAALRRNSIATHAGSLPSATFLSCSLPVHLAHRHCRPKAQPVCTEPERDGERRPGRDRGSG